MDKYVEIPFCKKTFLIPLQLCVCECVTVKLMFQRKWSMWSKHQSRDENCLFVKPIIPWIDT
jgi:hypothetical protein